MPGSKLLMPKSTTPIIHQYIPDTVRKRTFRRWFVQHRRIILGLSLAMALLPFFALSLSNFPFWDDYWMADLARRVGVWQAQHIHYMTWGGRYSLVFILTVLNPLTYGWVAGFRLVPLLMLGGTLLAAQAGLHELTARQLSGRASLCWAAVALLLHLALMPSIYPSFYWFVGSTVYQLPIILMLVVLTAALRALRAQRLGARSAWYAVALLGTACVVGLQELAVLLMGWTLLLLLLVSLQTGRRQAAGCWGGLLLCAVIGGVVSILAPGNFIRAESGSALAHHMHVGQILASATEHLLSFFAQPNQILMLLLTPVLFGRLLLRMSARRPLGFQLPFYVGVLFLVGGVAICHLFFAIISVEDLPHRTANFVWAWLFFGWILVLWAAIPLRAPHELRHALATIHKPVIALVVLLLMTGIQRRAWVEWVRNAPLWRAQHTQRFEQMRAAARLGQRVAVVDGFSGFTPRHVAIIGEPLVSQEHSASERNNNHITAKWFGLDSVVVRAPTMRGKLSDDL